MVRKVLLASIALAAGGVVAAVLAYQVGFNSLAAEARADRVIIEKGARRLSLLDGGTLLKEYGVALGREPIGPKMFEGDGKTPEGVYVIDARKKDSAFHLAPHISYPTPEQVARASAEGKSAGGQIMIHGIRNGLGIIGPAHRLIDWTDGCIAVTNAEIQELWRSVPDGTPVEIRP